MVIFEDESRIETARGVRGDRAAGNVHGRPFYAQLPTARHPCDQIWQRKGLVHVRRRQVRTAIFQRSRKTDLSETDICQVVIILVTRYMCM